MVVAFLRFHPASATAHRKDQHVNPDYSNDSNAYYPGSKRLRRAVAQPAVVAGKDDAGWDAKPVVKTLRGQQIELFTIGHLGMALGRAAVTMRLWERNGVIPTARMRLHNKNGKGGRRYYTRPQVEAIRTAAEKHGLMERGAPITPDFTRDVVAAWAALEKK